jgi:SH3 domain-containing YSC84-like protein 1
MQKLTAAVGQPVGNFAEAHGNNHVTKGNSSAPSQKLAEWAGRGLYTLRTMTSGGLAGGFNPEHLRDCQAVGVFSTVKIAVIVKYEHTHGFVIARTPTGWSAPSFYKMQVAGAGIAAGVDDIDTLMLLPSDKALDQFRAPDKEHKVEFHVGARPESGMTAPLEDKHQEGWMKAADKPIVYSMTSGFIVDVSAQTGHLKVDEKSNALFYGRTVLPTDILSGEVPPPQEFEALYRELDKAAAQA